MPLRVDRPALKRVASGDRAIGIFNTDVTRIGSPYIFIILRFSVDARKFQSIFYGFLAGDCEFS